MDIPMDYPSTGGSRLVATTLAQRRLVAQHVTKPALATPRAVVAHMGAVQAQDHAASQWALGLRMRRPSLAAIVRAVERGEILRTWPMRGTLHFVLPEDARWMLRHLAARAIRRAATRERGLGITPRTLETARGVLTRALRREGSLTRPEAYATLERAGVRTSAQRGIHVLGHLAHDGVLCVGPHEGKQATFVLLDEWAPERRDPEDPVGELARRYVVSHGPASAADLAWWTGLPRREARSALERARGIREDEDGFWSARAPRAARARPPEAHLLPAFDESAVAYKDRSHALERAGGRGPNAQIGLLSPCVVVDGQMVGTWGRAIAKDTVRIALKPTTRWSRDELDAIEAAAGRYARFLGLDAEIATRRPA
jgi:hypothetical protein